MSGTARSDRTLFRKEAVDFQHNYRQWGDVASLQPLSTKLVSWFLVASAAAIVCFVSIAQYSRKETALVVVHWALMRAELAAGNATGAQAQTKWLATHRGRVFAEMTTIEVLRFFNAAVSAEAMQQSAKAQMAGNRPEAGKA